MSAGLVDAIRARRPGILLYGLAPPKQATPEAELEQIAARQVARMRALPVDGLVVYDIQDESARTSAPRPFPFLPTVDPEPWAERYLAAVALPMIVYRSVSRDTPASFARWLETTAGAAPTRLSVLVGAPHRGAQAGLALSRAYAILDRHPARERVLLGGIAIAERHLRDYDEHVRMLAKMRHGCRFFVTQAVYDVTSTKSLLSDYAIALAEAGEAAVPVVLTFAPCGSERTLAFLKWLGIAFPRWLENDLRRAPDPLATSLALCERIFAEAWEYAREKGVPLGANVESVSIRRAEIEASMELVRRLRRRIDSA